MACCPVGDFCRGRVDYGAVNAGAGGGDSGAGSGTGSVDGSASGSGRGAVDGSANGSGGDTQLPGFGSVPGIQSGNNGPITITNGAAKRSNPILCKASRFGILIISSATWM